MKKYFYILLFSFQVVCGQFIQVNPDGTIKNDGAGHIVKSVPVFQFKSYQAGTLSQLSITVKGTNTYKIWANYGNTVQQLTFTGANQTLSSNFKNINSLYSIEIWGDLDQLQTFQVSNATIVLCLSDINVFKNLQNLSLTSVVLDRYNSIDDLPKTLLTLNLTNCTGNNIYGNAKNLSRLLTSLILVNTNNQTIKGKISDLPATLTTLTIRHPGSPSPPNWTGSFSQLPPNLTSLFIWEMGSAAITGNLNDIPKTVTSLTIFNDFFACTGNVKNLPPNLVSLLLISCSSNGSIPFPALPVKCNLNDIPKTVTSISLSFFKSYGAKVTGSVDSLPPNLTSITLSDVDTFMYGHCEKMPGTCTTINLNTSLGSIGHNIIYGGGAVPAWAATTITLQTKMTSANVDAFLISWAGTAGVGTKTVTLSGQRTSASDAAVATLNGKGKTIITAP